MAKSFFFKEIASVQYFVGGRPVEFELIPGNRGVLTLESPKDDNLIAALDDAAYRHVGGIVKVTEEQLAEKKSLAASMPSSSQRRKEMLRPMPKGPFDRKRAEVAIALAAKAFPSQETTRDAVPLTNSALAKASGIPPAAPPSAESPVAPPVEGFRPATRRISRKRAAEVAGSNLA